MIVRPDAIRNLLRAKGPDGQIAESAIVALSAALEAEAERLAEESARVLRVRNEARFVQRLEPLRRLTDEHVREAIRRSHGNP